MERICPICKSNVTLIEEITSDAICSQMCILVCRDCGHAIRLEDRDNQTNISIQIDEFDRKTKKPTCRPKWYYPHTWMNRRVQRLVGRKGRILDIGCGPGVWLSTFNDNWEKHGVDASGKAASFARDFAKADVFCGPFEEYQAPADSFDVITAFALIEHLIEPRTLLDWAYKHLKPGGLLLLMTGDRESRIAKKYGKNWPMYKPIEHVHFFSGSSLQHLVKESGFSVARREWRVARYPGDSKFFDYIGRMKHLLGLVQTPIYDRLYIYARKPK